jgi:hypothetical protein
MNRSDKSITKLLLLLESIVLITSCSAEKEAVKHEFKIIELPEYYEGKGAIIPANYASYLLSNDVKRVELSLNKIKEAETILKTDFSNWSRRLEQYLLSSGKATFNKNVKTRDDTAANFKKMFELDREKIGRYYRQYKGWIDESGDTVVTLFLFNYGTLRARHEFRDWRDKEIGLGEDFYYANTLEFTIDLSRKKIVFNYK